MVMTTSMQVIIITIIPSVIKDCIDALCSMIKDDIYVIVANRTKRSDTCAIISDGSAENYQHSVVRIVNIERNDGTLSRAI